MKIRYILFGLLAVPILFWSCSVTTDSLEQDPEVQKAVQGAEKKTMEMIDLLVEANATGDFGGVDQFLKKEDTDGEIAALIEQYGIGQGVGIPREFGNTSWAPAIKDFKDGDVVLFIGNGTSWQNMIMTLVYVCDYHHAGVFDEELADLMMDDTCFISSTIDTGVNGLCFQRLQDLVSTSAVISRLIYSKKPTALGLGVDYFRSYTQSVPTLYAFLHLNLEPVSRWNPFLWYCSKVPWRIYWDSGEMNIENNDLYELNDKYGKWTENRNTLFYQLYLKMLKCMLPPWAEKWAGYLVDKKLCRILNELITPDELHAYVHEADHWIDPNFVQ